MTPFVVVLILGLLFVLALLVVATYANQELAEENRRLRASIHPSTRKAHP